MVGTSITPCPGVSYQTERQGSTYADFQSVREKYILRSITSDLLSYGKKFTLIWDILT